MKIIIINVTTLGEVTRNDPLIYPNFRFLAHVGDILVFEAPDDPEEKGKKAT